MDSKKRKDLVQKSPFGRFRGLLYLPFRGLKGTEFSTNYQLLTTHYLKIHLWGILTAILFSCTVEERYQIDLSGGEEESGEVTLNFTVKVPGQSDPATRAMGEKGEHYIETIDVLLFKVDEDENEVFQYRAQGKDIVEGNDVNEKNFNVTLYKEDDSLYRLVVLANATDELNKLGSLTVGAHKEELLRRLIYKKDLPWNASGEDPGYFDPIPMWGETSLTRVVDKMTISEVKFLRMVARLDVLLNPAVDNFKLTKVYVYNRQSQGYIVPSMSDTIWTESTTLKVKAPSVPDSTQMIYDPGMPYMALGDTACQQEIYLMESRAKAASPTYADVTCVVVGGRYNHANEETYYRLDFLEADKETYKPILRNHLYRFTINSVTGSGHGSPEEAFRAQSLNMNASIFDWDQGDMAEVVFDGQYMLSVSQGEFTFSKDPTSATDKHNILTIYTDYDVEGNEGWKLDKITDSLGAAIDWLKVDIVSGLPKEKIAVHLLLDENEIPADRTGYIRITAGRLSYMITVTQTDTPEINLALYEGDNSMGMEITELIFPGRAGDIEPRQFSLEWAPRTQSPVINVNMVNGRSFPFDPAGNLDIITDGTIDGSIYNGHRTFTVAPVPMDAAETDPDQGGDPFLEKTSRIDFMVGNGVTYLTKNMFLRQINYGLVCEKEDFYLLDGKEHSLLVKSNTTWKAELWSNPKDVITFMETTTGGNDITGQRLKFHTRDELSGEPTIFAETAEILFTSARFDSVFVAIRCGTGEFVSASNSYLAKPGGMGLLIPVSRANEYTTQEGLPEAIGADDIYTAELVWTDNPGGIADDSNIKLLTEAGTGREGHILVLPGSATGNAVVAVKVGNVIKWSWHIWVTHDNPESDHTLNGYDFMDRNLGAVTNTMNQVTSMGLLYQWGRKDPFPGVNATHETSTELPVYTLDSNGFPIPAPIMAREVYATNNLPNSIQNPAVYYYVSNEEIDDWFTYSSSYQRSDFWERGTKTIYDPCPEGWRVPAYRGGNSPWQGLTSSNFSFVNYGSMYNSAYYPAAGYRNGDSFIYVGIGGFYWSASPGGTLAKRFYFNGNTIIYVDANGARSTGQSVRCVRDE